jgi:hypothetical protein
VWLWTDVEGLVPVLWSIYLRVCRFRKLVFGTMFISQRTTCPTLRFSSFSILGKVFDNDYDWVCLDVSPVEFGEWPLSAVTGIYSLVN